MVGELATTSYSIAEPFELAVKSLRKALADGNLKLAGELDMACRIRQRLLISTAPCRVLFVTGTPSAFKEMGVDPCAALRPLHVVVAARGAHTDIHLLRAMPAEDGSPEGPMMAAFRQLQSRIAQAVERIGMRSRLGA
jgi:hypothetical protein